MKRILITLLAVIIAVPLILGGSILFSYYTVSEDISSQPTLSILDSTVQPSGYEWYKPVFAGLVYRNFYKSPTSPVMIQEKSQSTVPAIVFPEGYTSTIHVSKNGTKIFDGNSSEWGSVPLLENGLYDISIQAVKEKQGAQEYGTFFFNTQLNIAIVPMVETSATSVLQGDVFAVKLLNLQENIVPTAQTEIGMVTFTEPQAGVSTAYVPIAYHCEPGDYTLYIEAGEENWELGFSVLPAEFTRQDMTIDVTDEVIGEANSPAAYEQYRDKIYPLFEMADSTQYWSGLFVKPASGYISTEYGLRRYTNGATVPTRHAGIDIAADEGTPVIAPNNGKVIFAENLLNTGNTLVIEHGGGLKSYFFHMHDLQVQVGDEVKTNQVVGTVGTTGYSTGPHLHYEVRIGNQTISPTLLFSGESSLYFFNKNIFGD